MICTLHPILFGWSNREDWDDRGMQYVWGRGEPNTGFWWGDLRERDHLEDLGVYWMIILKRILRKWDEGAWTGLSCLGIGTGSDLLWMGQRTFWYHKIREISRRAENWLAPQEGLCCVEWVSKCAYPIPKLPMYRMHTKGFPCFKTLYSHFRNHDTQLHKYEEK